MTAQVSEKFATVEDYLQSLAPEVRSAVEDVRAAIHQAAPGADEVISYNMPVFKLDGKPLIWVGAFKKHMNIFPGTIKFTPEKPLSDGTIKEILVNRLAEIS